jgi:hypothetical protein
VIAWTDAQIVWSDYVDNLTKPKLSGTELMIYGDGEGLDVQLWPEQIPTVNKC